MPVRIGSSPPPVRPKLWKMGSALKMRSSDVKSVMARICAMLDRMARCDSTTPFGRPSEPEVNSTTAGESELMPLPSSLGNRRCSRANSFTPVVTVGCRSSR
jgi:hypothetical protein